ncbi:MAG TPA: hypothetical protein VHP36_03060 [Chitinispirillaceae bacterium]|nr:hypothetical protein [Chitinispirillaceae bacterium]
MKKLLCILTFVLVNGIVISNCSNPAGISSSDSSGNDMSLLNDSDSENVLAVDTERSDFKTDSLRSELASLCRLKNTILDSLAKEKNWIRYAETLMEYGPRIDEIRAHMVGLDRYPYEQSSCRYIPFYSQEQISRIRSEGRDDLAERYIGINEAKQLLCK